MPCDISFINNYVTCSILLTIRWGDHHLDLELLDWCYCMILKAKLTINKIAWLGTRMVSFVKLQM